MKDYIERHALYSMLAKLTQKKPETIKTWFYRNRKDVKDENDFREYLNK